MHTTGVTRQKLISFDGANLPTEVATVAGSGSVAMTSGGFAKITSGAAARSAITFGNVLAWDLARLEALEFLVRPVAAYAAAVRASLGIIQGNQADNELGIAPRMLFNIVSDGSTNRLKINTNDNAGNAADDEGGSLPAAGEWIRLRMEFNSAAFVGGHPMNLNDNARGSSVLMSVSAATGGTRWRKIMNRYRFDLVTGNVQPIIQLGGAAGAELDVWEICAELTTPK